MMRRSKTMAATAFIRIAGIGIGAAFVIAAIAGEWEAGGAAISEQEAETNQN